MLQSPSSIPTNKSISKENSMDKSVCGKVICKVNYKEFHISFLISTTKCKGFKEIDSISVIDKI